MLLEQIKTDLKTAQKQKDEIVVSTLRFLLAALYNKEIELKKRGQLSDEEAIGVIRQQVEQHKESIRAYRKGKRDDLAEKEEKELAILSKYLPQQISPEELEKIVKETIGEMGEVGEKDFGRIMGRVMGKVRGRAEGKLVAEMVKKLLSQNSAIAKKCEG